MPAKKKDKVRVHLIGKFEDGSTFVDSRDGDPEEFVLGSVTILAAIEEEIVGMNEGDKKSFTLGPDKAFGESDPKLVFDIAKTQVSSKLKPGEMVEFAAAGQNVSATVVEIKDDKVVVDANHPLAGKTVTFEVELLKIL